MFLVGGFLFKLAAIKLCEYFIQFIHLVAIGGDDVIGALETLRSTELWLKDNSVRFVVTTWYGVLVRAILIFRKKEKVYEGVRYYNRVVVCPCVLV